MALRPLSTLWILLFLLCADFLFFAPPSLSQTQPTVSVSKAVILTCQNAVYKTIPELPIRIGDSIPFTIQIKFKNFPFEQNTQIIIAPEIHLSNKIIPLKTMRFKAIVKPTLEGALAQDTVMATLARKSANHFEHEVTCRYESGMESSRLEARVTIIQNNVSVELPLITISNRGFSTFTRLLEPRLELMDLDYEKEQLCVKDIFTIYYPPNEYSINSASNKLALGDLLKTLQSSREILEINIRSSASPEGEAAKNDNLAYKRMEVINKLIVKELLSRKINALTSSEVFAEGFINTKWQQPTLDSALEFLNKSNFSEYQRITPIIISQNSDSVKLQQLMKLNSVNAHLTRNVFPKMRYCAVEILSTPSDESINSDLLDFQNNDVSREFTCTRYIQMALASNSEQTRIALYRKAISMYPEDFRAHFKLGMIHYQNNDIKNAEKSFQQASILNPKSGEAKNNLGICYAKLNEFEMALRLFQQSANLNRSSSVNQAYVNAQLGNFQEAMDWFGPDAACNRAICQLGLNLPYAAIETLQNSPQMDALSHYLLAIAGSRINDIALICSNLKIAISESLQYRNMAKAEADFNPYRLNMQFREAIKIPAYKPEF